VISATRVSARLPRWLGRWLARRVGWLFAIGLACIGVAVEFGPLQRFDLLLYDAIEPRVRRVAPAPEALIAAIDEHSLVALGRWPWNRQVHAELIDRLNAADVAAVGMAVLFAEAAEGDAQFAQALARSDRVVLAVAPGLGEAKGPGVREILPVPELAANSAALGHVDLELDADSLVRRTFRRAGGGAPKWDALALAVWRQAQRRASALRTDGDSAVLLPASLAWKREGELLLPYPDARGAVPVVSVFDVLERPELGAQLRGRIVFVGTTVSGLDAGLATPRAGNFAGPEDPHGGTLMPAVEFHARAYEALRNGSVYRTADAKTTLAFTVGVLAVPLLVLPWLGRRLEVAGAALVLVPPLTSALVLQQGNLWLPPGAAITAFLFGCLLSFGLRLKRTRQSLQHARSDAHATLCSIADAVITVDRQQRIVFLNPVAEKLAGVTLSAVRGKTAGEFIGSFFRANEPAGAAERAAAQEEPPASEFATLLRQCLEQGTTLRLPEPMVWQHPDGRHWVLRVTLTPIGNGSEGAVVALNDVTESIAFTARLRHEATHDALTGLPNRTLLLDRLRQALAHARRSGRMVAVLFVDLDRFKRINDSLGHHCGDEVLRVVAQRLQAVVRAEDTIARWGGDEFIVLIDRAHERTSVTLVAGKILDQLEREVRTADGTNLLPAGSIGISIGPHDSDDADSLLSMADQAMYRSKMAGGGRFTFYSVEMNTWSRDRLSMESALRRALANREFELFYQPQVDIASGRLVGVESLIRWRQPDVGLVRPDHFIPAAEECGAIRKIGAWVIHEATEQAARWSAEGLRLVPLAVNVSARQCADMSVVQEIRAALAASRIDPALLKVELTESTAMHNVDFVATLLRGVHDLGVGIAVDDFGTGYSSLACLKRFPISELKIDKSFVGGITAGGDDAAIVRGTIALAHGLGLTVVAEGVETVAQLGFLAGHGCNVAQGYYFAQPLPAEEVRRWLNEQSHS
jgi:diguanylate cyclase (GGDEF)-like protein